MDDPWQELGDGIFRRRYQFLDQNIGLVLGGEAVLVIDTRANPTQAREIMSDVARITPLPVGWVFNTHYHWDHTFGNQAFPRAQIWGHEMCARELEARGPEMLEEVLAEWVPASEHGPYREVVPTPPSQLFADAATIDLGDRVVQCEFLGLGHTNSDAILHADGVTFAGDLVEEGGPPSVGDSFPLGWAETLVVLQSRCRSTVVPGHGDIVDPGYVAASQAEMAWLARLAEAAFSRGLTAEEVDLAGAPYPAAVSREAIRRAYEELSSSVKFSQ